MAGLVRYLYIDIDNPNRKTVCKLDGDPPVIGEQASDVFVGCAVSKVVKIDRQPCLLDGHPIEGGRIWVRCVIQ